MKKRILCLLLLAALLPCVSALADGLPAFTPQQVPAAPDYATDTAWLAKPERNMFPVDVFWVYPTVLHDQTHWLMDSADPEQRWAAHGTLTRQASVFSGQANLYAPMYRQMNMAALSLDAQEQDRLMAYGKDDVWRAFVYYLKHLNQGRPFILAGHSQGSDILTTLAVEHWGSLGVEKQLVAAYLIGWSITSDDLAHNTALSMCTTAEQTGCFLSYNTVAKGRQSVAPTIRPGAVVTNPLSWTVDDTLVPASENLGARFFASDGTSEMIAHFTSARAVDGGLEVVPQDPARVESGPSFPAGVYHEYDYSLFYENLRRNAARRIRAKLDSLLP